MGRRSEVNRGRHRIAGGAGGVATLHRRHREGRRGRGKLTGVHWGDACDEPERCRRRRRWQRRGTGAGMGARASPAIATGGEGALAGSSRICPPVDLAPFDCVAASECSGKSVGESASDHAMTGSPVPARSETGSVVQWETQWVGPIGEAMGSWVPGASPTGVGA